MMMKVGTNQQQQEKGTQLVTSTKYVEEEKEEALERLVDHVDSHVRSTFKSSSIGSHPFALPTWLYVLISLNCLHMLIHILIAPSTWLNGWSKWHDDHMDAMTEALGCHNQSYVVACHTVTKYTKEWTVQFSHILPGAIWAGAIPFQFHPTFRKMYPAWHRRVGYAFMVSVVLMTFGLYMIERRGLSFEQHFELDGKLDPTAPYIPIGKLVVFLGFWFLWTAGMALYYARAATAAAAAGSSNNGPRDRTSSSTRRNMMSLHMDWMIRHVGSGIWVAWQRLFLLLADPLYAHPITAVQQRSLFGTCAFVSAVMAIVSAEVIVDELRQQRKQGVSISPGHSKKKQQ